jgi:hypothetical protein
VVAPGQLDQPVEVTPLGIVTAARGAEDAVQLHVHPHELGAAGLGLGEHALLQRLRRAAGEQLGGG